MDACRIAAEAGFFVAVGQLAGGMAHDFNNILTAIQFNASLLQSTDELPAEAAECARA